MVNKAQALHAVLQANLRGKFVTHVILQQQLAKKLIAREREARASSVGRLIEHAPRSTLFNKENEASTGG